MLRLCPKGRAGLGLTDATSNAGRCASAEPAIAILQISRRIRLSSSVTREIVLKNRQSAQHGNWIALYASHCISLMSHLLTLTLALAAIVRVRPCWGRSAAFPETGRPAKAIWPYRRDHGSRR